jgi:hypothetical protein
MYLSHVNRFTGLRYKDDPAIIVLLLSNENDVTNHYGNALLPDKGVPIHSAVYMRESAEFADKYSLPKDKVWRSWEDGPSKLFLNDLQHRFETDMIANLRALGVASLIVTTSTWGNDPLSSLPALTAGDLIDVHSYGGVGELERNPIFGPNLVHWMAAAQVVGKPLSVSEWGLDRDGSLAADRQDIPLYVAASAAMQGWSAVLFYAYSQEALNDVRTTPDIYQAYNDPALIASLPAAALLYRQGHVRQASTSYVFAPGQEALFYRSVSPSDSIALRTASERGRLLIAMPKVPELPWLESSAIPPGAKIIRNPQESQIPLDAAGIVSDSGELSHNWDEGVFTINSPRTQAAMGWLGGRSVTLADLEVDLATRNAVVAVQSLDGNAINQSRKILISLAARSVVKEENRPPFYSEPVTGKIAITAPPGLTLSAGNSRSENKLRNAVSYADGRYLVRLDRSLSTEWLLLRADSAEKPAGGGEISHRTP